MSKFHINKHGVPAPCRAKEGNCPLGGEGEHFDTRAEAQSHADKVNQEEFGVLGGLKNIIAGRERKREVLPPHRNFQDLTKTEFRKLSNHRVQYHLQEVDMSYEDKVAKIQEATKKADKETGRNISRRFSETYTKGMDPEEKHFYMLDVLRGQDWEEENVYLNKVDEAMDVDSKEGYYISKRSNESKSIYFDNKGPGDFNSQRIKIESRIKNRQDEYRAKAEEDLKGISDGIKKVMLVDESRVSRKMMNSIAKDVLSRKEYKKIESMYSKELPNQQRWDLIEKEGVNKLGEEGFRNKVVDKYLSYKNGIIENNVGIPEPDPRIKYLDLLDHTMSNPVNQRNLSGH